MAFSDRCTQTNLKNKGGKTGRVKVDLVKIAKQSQKKILVSTCLETILASQSPWSGAEAAHAPGADAVVN